MIFEKLEEMKCTLKEPDANEPIDLKHVHFIQLKENYNKDEVLHFVEYVGKRLLQYQFTTFYDYNIEIPKGSLTTEYELQRDVENKLSNFNQDVHIFKLKCALGDVHNEFSGPIESGGNGGADVIEGVEWVFRTVVIDMFDMRNLLYLNADDIPYEDDRASFYGRSMAAVFAQNYVQRDFPELVARNFRVIKGDDPEVSKTATEIIRKQRGRSLNREQTIAKLKELTCRKTGKSLECLLDKDYELPVK